MIKNKLFIALCIASCLNSTKCISQETGVFKQVIQENKQEWIGSWENEPLVNFEHATGKTNYYQGYGKSPMHTSFYIYSPSNTLFVDVYSRTMEIDIEGGDTILQYLEPESEVVLFDTINKSAYSLAFFGSGTYYEDLIWVTDTCFIVMGYRVDHDDNGKMFYRPMVFVYDLKNMRRLYYEGQVNRRRYSYFDKKFKTMKFR